MSCDDSVRVAVPMETRYRRNGTTYEVPARVPRDGVRRVPYKAPVNKRYPTGKEKRR